MDHRYLSFVPKEVSHVYAMVEKFSRFSIFPELDGVVGQKTGDVCNLLSNLAVFSEGINLLFLGRGDGLCRSIEATEIFTRLQKFLLQIGFQDGVVLQKLPQREKEVFHDLLLACLSADFQGAFGGGLCFEIDGENLKLLFDCCKRMRVCVGANEYFKKAISFSKRKVKGTEKVYAVVRGEEIELIADIYLPKIFVEAYSIIGNV